MKPKMLRYALLVALAVTPIAFAQDKAAPAGHKMWSAKSLEWKDLPSIQGAKIALLEGPMNEAVPFTARIKMPAGGKIPPHTHPGIGRASCRERV